MKRIFASIAAASVLLLNVGCGQGNAIHAGFAADDLSLTVSGTPYTVNVDIDTVITDLGSDYNYAEGMSCDYDGLDKTYGYDMAVFYTNPLSEGDMVNEIYTESNAVTTSKGIAVGASRDDVLAAYGEDCVDEGDLLIYRLDDTRTSLCFELENDSVWAIYLTNQSV